MVACDSSLQTLAFENESSWAEDVDTMTTAVQLCAPVELTGITQEMLRPERVTARRLAGTKGIVGPFSNIRLRFQCYATGHGSATSGATTINALYTLLTRTLGGGEVVASAGTTLTGGTVTVPTTTASGTFNAGGVCRIGALADTDGEGQFYAIATHVTTSLTVLNDLAGAPQNGAVLWSADNAYPADSACAISGTRFRVQTADLQFILHGGFPVSFGVTGLGPGEVPKFDFEWQFSWAEPSSATFPTTPTADEFRPSPNTADGSCFLQSYGTTTRALVNLRAFSIDYSLAVMPVFGGNGVNTYQVITGATRGRDSIFVNMTVDGEGVDTTPTYWDDFILSTAAKHAMWTGNSKSTEAFGIYLRQLVYAGNRPSQNSTGGRNTIPLRFEAIGGTTTTNDRTLAPIIFAAG